MRRAHVFGLLPVLLLLLLPAWLEAATYYVNTAAGCSDGGTGQTQVQPFCSFTPINAISNGAGFPAGTTILLARGATWNQELVLRGNGSSLSNMNTLGAYGTATLPRPKIIRNQQIDDRGIRMKDPSYWAVMDLEVGNTGTGIILTYSVCCTNTGLRFSRLYLHHHYGIVGYVWDVDPNIRQTALSQADGINISSAMLIRYGAPYAQGSPGQYIVSDVVLEDVETAHNSQGIYLAQVGNLTFNRVYSHDDDSGGVYTPCPSSIAILASQTVFYLNSIIDRGPACFAHYGTTAFQLGGFDAVNRIQKDVLIANSIIRNTPAVGAHDQTGADYEAWTDNVDFRNNYIHNNAGAGIEFLFLGDRGRVNDQHTNADITGNLFVGNASASCLPTFGAAIALYSNASASLKPTGIVRDNLYRETSGLTYACGNSAFDAMTFSNNLAPVAATPIAHSATDFAATQGTNNWRYQYRDAGGAWTDMTYASAQWTKPGAPTPNVRAFEQTPGTCPTCAAARVWVAPSAGAVSIRARALKSDFTGGDGAAVRLERGNGTSLWSNTVAFNDRTGVEMVLDNVTVTSGEALRFITEPGAAGNNANDLISWVPVIAYTTLTASTPVFQPEYIYGAHEVWSVTGAGAEVHMTTAGTKGWIFQFGYIRPRPNVAGGFSPPPSDFRFWTDQGFGVMTRIDSFYGALPHQADFATWAQAVATYVAGTQGCHIWVIGNELNLSGGWPSGESPSYDGFTETITPAKYAQVFALVRNAIRALPGHENDLVVTQGLSPFVGAEVTQADVLNAIGQGNVDGVAIHAYTDNHLVSEITGRFRDDYQRMMGGIPTWAQTLPAWITEAFPVHADPNWSNVNNGYVKAMYAEVNAWNQGVGHQQIRGVMLFLWDPATGFPGWTFSDKPNVSLDWREAMANGYRWNAAPLPPPPPPSGTPVVYYSVTGYSGVQGQNQWSYRDSTGALLTYNAATNVWLGSEGGTYSFPNIHPSGGHPGSSRDAVRRWTSPGIGTITITGIAADYDPGGGDGIIVRIVKNGATVLWTQTIANGNSAGVSIPSVATAVAAGDTIDFVINRNGDTLNDNSRFDPTVTYVPPAPVVPVAPESPANLVIHAH